MFKSLFKLSRKNYRNILSIFMSSYLVLSPLVAVDYEIFAAAPTITEVTPLNGSYHNGDVSYHAKVNKGSGTGSGPQVATFSMGVYKDLVQVTTNIVCDDAEGNAYDVAKTYSGNSGDGSDYTCVIDTTGLVDGVYEMRSVAIDRDANNTSSSVFATFDNTAPEITMLGTTPVELDEGDSYVDDGATALDNIDGDITASIVTVNPVNTSIPGTYYVTYNVSDTAGNASEEVVREVNVNELAVVDETAPDVPTLESPDDGRALFGNGVDQLDVTLEWSEVSDPSEPVTYDLEVLKDGEPFISENTGALTEKVLLDLDLGFEYMWRVRAIDGAGNVGDWSEYFTFTTELDDVAPLNPTDFSSEPVIVVDSTKKKVQVEWPGEDEDGGATDGDGSGVAGYSWVFLSEGDDPDVDQMKADGVAPGGANKVKAISDKLSTGTYYFYLITQDNAGNWSEDVASYGPFNIIAKRTGLDLDIEIQSHGDDEMINDSEFEIEGLVIKMPPPVTSITLFFYTADTDTVIVTCGGDIGEDDLTFDDESGDWSVAVNGASSCQLPEGIYDIGVRLNNGVPADKSNDKIFDFVYDLTPPTDPSEGAFTSSHEVGIVSDLNEIEIDWPEEDEDGGATDNLSGVKGYSWVFSNVADTLPDAIAETPLGQTSANSGPLSDGTWFFHLRTLDNAGNWTSTIHYGPFVIDTSVDEGDDDEQDDTDNIEEDDDDGVVLGENTQNQNNIVVETQTQDDDEDTQGEVLGLTCEVKQTASGYVYVDTNGNGIMDSGEEGIADVELEITYTDEEGEEIVIGTVTTDENGKWEMELCSAVYSVSLDEEGLPSDVKLTGEGVLSLTVEDDGENVLNFALESDVADEDAKKKFNWWWIVAIVLGSGLLYYLLNLWKNRKSGGEVPTEQYPA